MFLNFSGPQQGEQRPNATSRTTGAQTFILQDFLPISCEVVFFFSVVIFFSLSAVIPFSNRPAGVSSKFRLGI